MSCIKERRDLEAAKDDLAKKEDEYGWAWASFLAVVVGTAGSCGAAAVEIGLNPFADAKCAAGIAGCGIASSAVDDAAGELGTAEAKVENARAKYNDCVNNCPSWSWAGK